MQEAKNFVTLGSRIVCRHRKHSNFSPREGFLEVQAYVGFMSWLQPARFNLLFVFMT